jgi:hypothetical protein
MEIEQNGEGAVSVSLTTAESIVTYYAIQDVLGWGTPEDVEPDVAEGLCTVALLLSPSREATFTQLPESILEGIGVIVRLYAERLERARGLMTGSAGHEHSPRRGGILLGHNEATAHRARSIYVDIASWFGARDLKSGRLPEDFTNDGED